MNSVAAAPIASNRCQRGRADEDLCHDFDLARGLAGRVIVADFGRFEGKLFFGGCPDFGMMQECSGNPKISRVCC